MAIPLMAAVAGAQLVGGLIGQQQASSAADAQRRALEQRVAQFNNIPLPDVQAMKLSLEELVSQGNFSPEEVRAVGLLGSSAYEQIQTDPRLQQEQTAALDMARQRAMQGFTAQDAALLDNYLRGASAQAASQAQTITQDAVRRGMGGSGTALAAALQASQGAANQMSSQAMQTAATRLQQQQQNADLLQRMAASMEQNQYSRQSDLASKRDSISEFNARLRQDLESANVGARNKAQLANLAERQRIADANVGTRNKQHEYNTSLIQQNFENQLRRATGAAGGYQGIADAARDRGQAQAEGTAKMATGLGAFLTALGQNEEDEKNTGLGGNRLGSFATPIK